MNERKSGVYRTGECQRRLGEQEEESRLSTVKYWDSNSMGDEGGRQGRFGVNSDDFLQCRTMGASTQDLMVTEFQTVCGQTDLASACVLCPLNRLVLYFKMRRVTG